MLLGGFVPAVIHVLPAVNGVVQRVLQHVEIGVTGFPFGIEHGLQGFGGGGVVDLDVEFRGEDGWRRLPHGLGLLDHHLPHFHPLFKRLGQVGGQGLRPGHGDAFGGDGDARQQPRRLRVLQEPLIDLDVEVADPGFARFAGGKDHGGPLAVLNGGMGDDDGFDAVVDVAFGAGGVYGGPVVAEVEIQGPRGRGDAGGSPLGTFQ